MKEEIEINNLRYMVFKTANMYYMGIVEIDENEQVKYKDSFLNILKCTTLTILSNGAVAITGYEYGLGDLNYYLNLKIDEIISSFTPSDVIVELYEDYWNTKLDNIDEMDVGLEVEVELITDKTGKEYIKSDFYNPFQQKEVVIS